MTQEAVAKEASRIYWHGPAHDMKTAMNMAKEKLALQEKQEAEYAAQRKRFWRRVRIWMLRIWRFV